MHKKIYLLKFITLIFTLSFFFSCDSPTADDASNNNPSNLVNINVISQSTPATQGSGSVIMGNNEGTIQSTIPLSIISNSRSLTDLNSTVINYNSESVYNYGHYAENRLIDILNSFIDTEPIAEFKIAADIHLLSSSQAGQAAIMNWGGDPTAEPMIDLLSGIIESNIAPESVHLKPIIYETVVFQLNTYGDILTLEDGSSYTWNDIVPYFCDTSNQMIVFSSFVDQPFITYLETDGVAFNPEDFQTIVDAEATDQIEFFFNCFTGLVPFTEEFIIAAEGINIDDPGPGNSPWIFLPLYEPIDLSAYTSGDKIAFSIEFFFKSLLNKYQFNLEDSEAIYLLSPFNTYNDENDNTFYGPLPLKISFAENTENGIAIE